jgi:hypothetical protein
MPVAGFLGIGLTASDMSAFRQGLNESGYVEISLHGLSPCGRGR